MLAARLGYVARAIAFGVIGAFLVLGGVESNPEEAKGLAGALSTLAAQPFGPFLLALAGLGLIGYGIHSLIAARYRRMVLD